MKTKYEASADARPKELCRRRLHVKDYPGICKECRRDYDKRRPKRPSRAVPPEENRSMTGGSRLDEDDVRTIRRSVNERGMPVHIVAGIFQMHEDSIRRIARGGTWKWVK